MLYLHPNAVNLNQLQKLTFQYADCPGSPAKEATRKDGENFFNAMVEAWVKFLQG